MPFDTTQIYADKMPRLAQRAVDLSPRPGVLQTQASIPSIARAMAAMSTAEPISGMAGKARIARAMQHALGNVRIARMGCSSCGGEAADGGGGEVQREALRAPVGPEGSDHVPPSVERALASSQGQPLPHDVRRRMEGALGAPLGDVRVHTGEQSARANRDVSAAAFTAGRDIHFAPGRYNPHSSEGQQLLGHELTHVVQQRSGRVPSGGPRIGPAGDAFEREADQAGQSVQRAMNATLGGKHDDEADKRPGVAMRTLAPALAHGKQEDETNMPGGSTAMRATSPMPEAKHEDEANMPGGPMMMRAMAPMPAATYQVGVVQRVNTGRCTEQRYNELNQAVYAACKGPNKPQSCARVPMRLAELRLNQQRFVACAAARQARETECWGGSDAGHREQIQAMLNGARTCKELADRLEANLARVRSGNA